jgi:type I restriction enzyme S subunit
MSDVAPKGWRQLPLADCGRWVSGGTPSRQTASFWGGDIPWISAKSLKQFDVVTSEEQVTEAGAAECSQVPAGTVLFVVRGMSLAKEFRVGVATRPVTFNQDLRGIIPHGDVDGRYLGRFLAFAAPLVLAGADNASHGTMRLNSADLQALVVPMPPLPEQKRIATILGKAECIRRRRQEAVDLTETLAEAIFTDVFGSMRAESSDWPVRRMEELFEAQPNYGSMEVPVGERNGVARWLDLRVANIQDGKLDLTSRKYVALQPEMLERHVVLDGDLLLARAIGSADHLGKCIIARPNGEDWAFDSHLMRVRFRRDLVEPDFIHGYLTGSAGRHEFLRNSRRSAVQFNINTKEFAEIRVPLPPLDRQREYLRLLNRIRRVEERQIRAEEEASSLFDSLAQRAFRGEL